jgi:gliding motility-associated-like protein
MKQPYTRSYLLLLLLLCFVQLSKAQSPPVNDDCINATVIDDPSQYCSSIGGETNIDATVSAEPSPSCVGAPVNDTWYRFTATSADIDVFVFADVFSSLGGPIITLYSGDCANLTEVGCVSNTTLFNIQTLKLNTLVPGQTYYLRIASIFTGNFQLCLRSGLFANEVSGDCPTAVQICDKDPITVPFVAGPGTDPAEWDGVDCLAGGFSGEFNTSWFVFTAATTGTLEFTLIPDAEADDLDFMVYHLPNGPDDCESRILERCMVAGSFSPLEGCYGPTGLNATATDISQPPGCLPGDDNFLMFMDLVAGETYALSVNNFTSSGNGFSIEWGGTADFEGPKVGFKTDDADNIICRGETLTITDTSEYANGSIDQWLWTFGANAVPENDTTQGPHEVQFLETGTQTIKLILLTDMGCVVKRNLDVQVDSCCAVSVAVDILPDCLPDTSCRKAVALVQNAISPITYEWSNGVTDSVANMLGFGDYTLIVEDAFGCRDTVSFNVDLRQIFEIPNAFTPNGDQSNDVFQPVSTTFGLEILQIQVWNRWGNLVYDGTNTGWDGNIDGSPAASDVYVYKVKIRMPDGREEIRSKDVTLIR